MLKPEIRHAGIVDVTFGESVLWRSLSISMAATSETAASSGICGDTKGSKYRQAVQDSIAFIHL